MSESYNSLYTNDVSDKIGTMLEYATRCGFEPLGIWDNFICSEVAAQIEKGNPRFLGGYSGRDYLDIVVNTPSKKKTKYGITLMKEQDTPLSFNKYYWAGSVLAKIQQKSGLSFYDIERRVPFKKILKMYPIYHEADIAKLYDDISDYLTAIIGETNLKRIRIASGLSQSQLARTSKVELRSIQMYEQRRNDINKAQGETLRKLARTLGCNIEDLLED
jgi:DNA-binding XRE family transcriptional regulator